MADVIEEIPIEEAATMEEVVAEATEAPPEKPKRGRPRGSKNKAPQRNTSVPEEAPKPKRAAKRRPPSPQSRSPSPPRHSRASFALPEPERPPPLDSRQIAAEVLQILSTRHLDLRQAKREKYRTWFQ